MKAVFFILFVIVGLAWCQPAGSWQKKNVSDIDTDVDVSAALNWGLDQVAAREGVNNTLWERVGLLSYETQVVAGMNYRFVVEQRTASNEARNLTLTVNERPWEGSRTLVSYSVDPDLTASNVQQPTR